MKKNNKALLILTAVLCAVLIFGAVFLVMYFMHLHQANRQMEEQFSQELEESRKTIDELKEQEEELDSELEKARAGSVPEEFLVSIMDCQPGELLEEKDLYMANPGIYFTSREIREGDEVHLKIADMLKSGNTETEPDKLRCLRMPYYNLDGDIQVGEMVVRKSIALEVLDQCQKLFQEKYAISSMSIENCCWPEITDWETLKEKLISQ